MRLSSVPAWFALAGLVLVKRANSACHTTALNRRVSEEVVPEFNAQIERDFEGQEVAIKAVRAALSDYTAFGDAFNEGPLILHLVGPSGTGKSLLSEIIAKSLFDDCTSLTGDIKGKVRTGFDAARKAAAKWLPTIDLPSLGVRKGLNAMLRRSCSDDPDKQLENYRQACGVVYTHFSIASEDAQEDAVSHDVMQNFLDNAARELHFEPRSVMILDDFNYCPRPCAAMLKELITSGTVRTKNGKTVSAARAVILLVSDLENAGLVLQPGETYEDAVTQTVNTARSYWGVSSPHILKAQFVAFAPLSEMQILKILDKIISKAARKVRLRIKRYLERRAQKEGSMSYEWQGNFYMEDHTKTALLDLMHWQIAKIHARALTEGFQNDLAYAIRHPPVEERLKSFKQASDHLYSNEDIIVKIDPESQKLLLVLG